MIARETHGDITLLRLAHGKASALDLEFLRAIDEALKAEATSDARAIVLTGTGSIFSAGVDLHRILSGGRDYIARFLPALDDALLTLLAFDKPVVAAINGHAIAGGAIIAAACDHRLLARGNAQIGVSEMNVGVPFPPIALEILRLVLAPHVLMEAVVTGRTWRADESLARGFVDEIVEPDRLIERALAVANELAAIPSRSFASTKRLLRQPIVDFLEAHAARVTPEIQDIWSSPAVHAAIRAFVEKTIRK